MSNEKINQIFKNKDNVPKHIAIIMDGNGRWAKKNNRPRVFGHNEGIKTVRRICEAASELELVKHLTLYAFSTENWKRPAREIKILMHLFKKFLQYEVDELNYHNIKLKIIGNIEVLPNYVKKNIEEAIALTSSNNKFTLNLAVNYGSQDEIINALKNIVTDKVPKDKITKELFETYLYTKDMPPVDLLIRTSGEYRISNFLLWQIAYSEILITETLWPDYSKDDFYDAILEYQKRNRRFGGI
jgi:undecaprenyl diphosphate synthase